MSEADTRAKVVDKILCEVCGWPEAAITREEQSGFIDYSLRVQSRRCVAVEAKKEGISFTFPARRIADMALQWLLQFDRRI